MSTLVHATFTLRKTARASSGFLAAAVFALLDLLGVFSLPHAEMRAEHFVVAGFWAVVFGVRAKSREEAMPAGARAWLDLELGLLVLVLAHAVVQSLGGLTSDAYPAIYVLVAFLAAFAQRPAGTLLVALAVLLEAGLYFVTEDRRDAALFFHHAVFVLLFGVLNLAFTRAEIARVREHSRKELDQEKVKLREESRMFRLLSSAERGERDDERLFQSSVEEVHHALYHVLHLVHRSLDLHTCVLLLLEEGGEKMRIVELVTDGEDIASGPFKAGEGAVGAVAKRGQVMSLEHLRPGYKGLCYYQGPSVVSAFLGVPVEEGGQVIGALCADRLLDRGFTAREEEVLKDATRQIVRGLSNERVFLQLERSKREQTILYRASQSLGAALDESAVMTAGLEAAQEIAPYDFAALTLYDASTKTHEVKRAVGEDSEKVRGLSFRDNTSLTAMVVKNRHYLPYRGEFDARSQTVFTRRANLRGMESMLILPLIVREDAIGTLALAARRPDAFGDAVRPTLQVLANQLAVSMANAAAVKRLEEMATIDGLTGCLNKRTFLEELDKRLKSAERFGRKLSLIVTDIDHFKNVNDTYGHATGDVVIKELGAILRNVKRETDIVARFGGEEFCVLCEETDTPGAIHLAERVRVELGETVFQTELGKLQVRASLGVATFPMHARTAAELFEVTDKALYAAKHAGRNQVCTAA
jgi:diguanylate cyclase (GGDEF)-like protein